MAAPDFNEASFVEQMVHNQHRLFGYVVTLVPNRDDAEEVFQEACLTLWNARQAYRPGLEFMPWACGIAKNKVLEFFRRNRHRRREFFNSELLEELAYTRMAIEESLESRGRALGECLAKLREPQRQLVEKCYSGGSTFKAVAEGMNMTPTALRMRLMRIRKLLFDCIGRKTSAGRSA